MFNNSYIYLFQQRVDNQNIDDQKNELDKQKAESINDSAGMKSECYVDCQNVGRSDKNTRLLLATHLK